MCNVNNTSPQYNTSPSTPSLSNFLLSVKFKIPSAFLPEDDQQKKSVTELNLCQRGS